MDILIEELKTAIQNKLYFIAINISLTIPDICSALESENSQASSNKYKSWIETYLVPKYKGFITGDDIYKIRCASLHQGKYNHDSPRFEKIVFTIPGGNLSLHNVLIGKMWIIDAEAFVLDMIESYSLWKENNKDNEFVKFNSEESFRAYDNGYPGLSNFGYFIG